MADASMVLSCAALAAFVGLAWLALAMDAHWQQVHGGAATLSRRARVALRTLGVAGLALSAVLCFSADHASMAVLVWVMLLAGAALSVALTLSWRPSLLRTFWPSIRQ